ncbi:glutathione S-transferase family protein [Sphingosinithalassobacter sp. LHW66-3]|uniref:glutathione S-transferase family protein n=1 Tax=Sphingosinithalassobacter sp. LHW66-3 TaxID=3424718 RepID=UPI003D6B67ED
MTDELVFYTNPMSRGRIARWMLEETGADYRTELLDYGSTMKAEAYLSVNPMGKVPAIVHNGRVVTECAAICAYLAESFPDSGLAPRAEERADYYRWLFFAAGPLEQAVTNNWAKFVPGDDQAMMFGYGSYDRAVDVLEYAVSRNPYIAGERFTAADVYVGSSVAWGTQFGTLPGRDAFAAYVARVTDRDAYRRATELDDAAMPEQAPA